MSLSSYIEYEEKVIDQLKVTLKSKSVNYN